MSNDHDHHAHHQPDAEDGPATTLERRQFLKMLGASFAALSLPGCEFRSPRETIVPFRVQPEEAVPGVARWYASTCAACPASCGMLVKVRDGRPIKVEGNPDHPLSRGGLCARGQASVLDLYDSTRLRGPKLDGKDAAWKDIDARVGRELDRIRKSGGQVRILSPTLTSPSLIGAIEAFCGSLPGARHVIHDTQGAWAILEAHQATHGRPVLPWYRFDKAKVIVSLDADFLGTWISPVEFTRDWAAGRRLTEGTKSMSWHVQIESGFSLTGANADLRVPVKPSAMPVLARALLDALARRRNLAGKALPAPAVLAGSLSGATLDRIATELIGAEGQGLVVSGLADPDVQVLVNAINVSLGHYGRTLDLTQPSLQLSAPRGALEALTADMAIGQVSALLIAGVDPVHEPAGADAFRQALEKVPLVVSLASRPDETLTHASVVAPDHDPFESWGDSHPHLGVYTIRQPTIAPLYDTRSVVESLLAWSGRPASSHQFLREVWEDRVFGLQDRKPFEAFWEKSLEAGVCLVASERVASPGGGVPARLPPPVGPDPVPADAFELVLHSTVALGDGRQANNPWLQELPDPLTKVTWGNHASISPESAGRIGVVEGRLVRLAAGPNQVTLPVHVQPGLPDGVVAVALGHGRPSAGPVAANLPVEKMFAIESDPTGGVDVNPLAGARWVTLEPLAGMHALAKTQTFDHQTVPLTGQDRRLVRETTLAAFVQDPHAGNKGHGEEGSLWPGHAYPGSKWEMAIDLTLCSGCSACVIACQAENNIPVVGKAEVRKRRDMQWIRLDRYYEGSQESVPESPDVSFMPMLCQHCDNAPCETVCPALATAHSSDGLNMQVYNRCVGTRYCANNCPYKVRRFNWFDYAHDDPVQNLVLNPDITVRSRGIMEKCSFCVQRINSARRLAREEGRRPSDAEVQPACAQSCPAEAIVFGDVNDPRSRIAKLAKSPRGYRVLGEVGTRPAIHYLTKIRNKKV